MRGKSFNSGLEYFFGAVVTFAFFGAVFFAQNIIKTDIFEAVKTLTEVSASLSMPTQDKCQSQEGVKPNKSEAQGQLFSLSSVLGARLDEAPKDTEEEHNASEPYAEELPYLTPTEQKGGEIIRKTYLYSETANCFVLPNGSMLKNTTEVGNEYLKAESAKEWGYELEADGRIEILIMHTHTTESYEPFERDYYEDDFTSRTTELAKTVVKVGEIIAERLRVAGIGVIHDTTLHDYPQYSGAYDRSCKTVQEILAENPDIKIVLDIHRDAIEDSQGVRYAPVCEVDGENAAQVMIIVGSKNVPNYNINLRLASMLQAKLDADYKGLARPILFADRNYNQELTHGSLLLEVGSNGNSLEEAFYTAELLGLALSEMFER